MKVAADLQRDATRKFTAFEEDIGRNQGVQQGHHADLQGRLEQFSQRSEAEVASMRSQVERLTAAVSELQSKASTAVNFQTETGKGAVQVRPVHGRFCPYIHCFLHWALMLWIKLVR